MSCQPASVWVTAAILVAAPSSARSASAPSPRTTLRLEDALELARHHNLDSISAADEAAIADAGIHTAREHPNPALALTTARIHSLGGDATALGNGLWARGYDSALELGQPLELGGQRAARRRAMAATADAAHARLADVRRTLEAGVVEAYAATALADANERIARESASYLRDEARIAEVRWKAGDISRSDLDQIEIAAARLDLDAGNAASAAIAQRLALGTLIGMPDPPTGIALADSLEGLVEGAASSRPTGGGDGVRPDLAVAHSELRRADAAWRLERARRIPDPTLTFQLEHQPPDRSNTIGFGVAFPLPLWNHNGGAIAAARAARDEAEQVAVHVEAAIRADVAAAQAAFDEASARWQRYRDDLRPRSDAVRRSVSLAYEKGGASLLDLLGAQRNDNEVRLGAMEAAHDAVIAAARLRSATTTRIPEVSRP